MVDVWMPSPLVSRVVIEKSIDALGVEVALAVDARRAANTGIESRSGKEAVPVAVFPQVRKRSVAAVTLEVADGSETSSRPPVFTQLHNFSG